MPFWDVPSIHQLTKLAKYVLLMEWGECLSTGLCYFWAATVYFYRRRQDSTAFRNGDFPSGFDADFLPASEPGAFYA